MRIIFIIYYLLITLLFVSCQESSSVEVEREKIASLLQKGDSCRQVGNEENSIAFYYRSLELAKQTGEQSLEAAASDRLGIVYLYRELYYDALHLFRQSASIYALTGENIRLALALRNIGRTNLVLHHSDSIACYYEQAIEVASRLEDKKLLHTISKELEAIYSKAGFYDYSPRLMLKCLDSVSDDDFCLSAFPGDASLGRATRHPSVPSEGANPTTIITSPSALEPTR